MAEPPLGKRTLKKPGGQLLKIGAGATNEIPHCSLLAKVFPQSADQNPVCDRHCTSGVCAPGDDRPQDRQDAAYSGLRLKCRSYGLDSGRTLYVSLIYS